MTELFAAASRIPYEEIGEEYLRRARALAEAEAMVTDEERRLAEGLELAKELTSKHHDQLDAIYGATAEEIRTRANHLDELRRRTRIYRVVDIHQDTTEEDRGDVAGYHVTDMWRTTTGQVIANPVASLETAAETSDDAEQEKSAAWEETFIASVDVAIDWAIEAQLFAWDLDEPRGSFIREMAGDDNIYTEEARAKLVRAGYMTKGEAERDGMTRKQIIMSYLMNVVSELSGRDGRKRYGRASEIVDVMIAQRLSEQSDTARRTG